MNWQFLKSSFAGFKIAIPNAEHTACVMTAVQDYRPQMYPLEAKEMAPMADIRQLGFSSGRYCAHRAQAELGLEVQPIARKDRVPQWPEHCIGSITHSNAIAAAIASTEFMGVGIDIEETGRVEEKLYRILFTEPEKQYIAQSTTTMPDLDVASILFSAKEAGYKAIYPLGKKFIGFQEAEITLQTKQQSFVINYLGDHQANKALNTGIGYWQFHADHVLTVFTIAK